MASRRALIGNRYVDELPGGVTVVAVPIFRDGTIDGAILGRSVRSPEIQQAIDALRGDRLTALAVAVVVAVLVSFLIASAITSRVKRLAESAARISEGELDEPLEGAGGRDEITDLGRALETMRGALRQTFSALREERDRLSAIFEALSDAVMVVGADGEVRFSNAAARDLIGDDGKAIAPLVPWLRRASRRPVIENDALRVGDRVYSLNARQLPAEGAVLAVVRDRTEELRREVAEREFVSNAAHELRNPIAGISGSVEVLRAGAKDDPEAREHFLVRLSEDSERISRLTESLLTLARMEAVGEGGAEALDVALVVEEAAEAVAVPEGIDVEIEVGGGRVGAGRPRPAAPGADRPAHQRLQEHAAARPGDDPCARRAPRRGRGPDRGHRHRDRNRRRGGGPRSSSASTAAPARSSRRASASASRSRSAWST